MNADKTKEKVYMNQHTGSVDTLDGWYPATLENSELVEVEKDENGDWVEVEQFRSSGYENR